MLTKKFLSAARDILLTIVGTLVCATTGHAQDAGPNTKPTERGNETEKAAPVVVANVDIEMGEVFTPDSVRVEALPLKQVPKNAVRDLGDFAKGRTSVARVRKGSPILWNHLTDAPGGGFVLIPKGFRVMSIKEEVGDVATGQVLPGDRINVIGHFRVKDTKVVKTIVRDAVIFSVDSRRDAKVNAEKQTVALLLKPADVEKVIVARSMGKLQLKLRPPKKHN